MLHDTLAHPSPLDQLLQPYDMPGAPGLVVGVARGGTTIYRHAAGLASVEHGVANTPATRMRIGSTSKQFACLAALLLAEEGLMDIDASIRRYLPELPASSIEPTLRQLMTHTGGYRCYLDLGFIADGLAIKPAGSALRTQLRQQAVNFAPGERAIYCNGGYHLLSLAIERAAGTKLGVVLERKIFAPLGMKDSALVISDFEIHPGNATLHVSLADGSYRRGIFPSEEMLGEGGIISTVDDMLIWTAHLRRPTVVGNASTWTQMMAVPTLNSGLVSDYALGLESSPYRGTPTISHSGGVIGGACQMLSFPEFELDVVIMTNGRSADPIALAEQIADVVLGDKLGGAPEMAASADYMNLIGKYISRERGLLYSISDLDGHLAISSFLQSPGALYKNQGMLELPFSKNGAEHVALSGEAGSGSREPVASLRVYVSGIEDQLSRIPDSAGREALTNGDLVGHYVCHDAEAGATITIGEATVLTMTGRFGSTRLLLDAVADDVWIFRSDHPFLPCSGFAHAIREGSQVRAIHLNTARTRNLKLVKTG